MCTESSESSETKRSHVLTLNVHAFLKIFVKFIAYFFIHSLLSDLNRRLLQMHMTFDMKSLVLLFFNLIGSRSHVFTQNVHDFLHGNPRKNHSILFIIHHCH